MLLTAVGQCHLGIEHSVDQSLDDDSLHLRPHCRKHTEDQVVGDWSRWLLPLQHTSNGVALGCTHMYRQLVTGTRSAQHDQALGVPARHTPPNKLNLDFNQIGCIHSTLLSSLTI